MKCKRWICALLAAGMLAGTAAADFTVADFTAAADDLYDLGLFQGKQMAADGTPYYDLEAPLTRGEAAVMLVRLLGKEEEAAQAQPAPFTDLSDWQKPAVSWLYRNGMTTGTSATTFSPEERCTAQMYTAFLLRALGYTEQAGDFVYVRALLFGREIGVVNGWICDEENFLRDHAAAMSRNALLLPVKGSTEDLLTQLTAQGAVEASKAQAFRDSLSPLTEVAQALPERVGYESRVQAAVRDGDDLLAMQGTVTASREGASFTGTLSVTPAGGHTQTIEMTAFRKDGSCYVSALEGKEYAGVVSQALFSQSALLPLVLDTVPPATLFVAGEKDDETWTFELTGGQVWITLDAQGVPVSRELSMKLAGVEYRVEAETLASGSTIRPQIPEQTAGYTKVS